MSVEYVIVREGGEGLSDTKGRSKDLTNSADKSKNTEMIKRERKSVKSKSDTSLGVSLGPPNTNHSSLLKYILFGMILIGIFLIVFSGEVISPVVEQNDTDEEDSSPDFEINEETPPIEEIGDQDGESQESDSNPVVVSIEILIFTLLGSAFLVILMQPIEKAPNYSDDPEKSLHRAINNVIEMLDSRSYDYEWKVGYAVAKLTELRRERGFEPKDSQENTGEITEVKETDQNQSSE